MWFSMTEATKSGYQERVTAGSLRSSECPTARLTRRDSGPPMNPPPLSGLGPQLLSPLDLPGCVLSPQMHPVPWPDVGSTSLQDPIQGVGGGGAFGRASVMAEKRQSKPSAEEKGGVMRVLRAPFLHQRLLAPCSHLFPALFGHP